METKARLGTVLKGSQRTRWRPEDGRESWEILNIEGAACWGGGSVDTGLPCKPESLSSNPSTHVYLKHEVDGD